MNSSKNITESLRKYCKENSFSLTKIESTLGISNGYINKIEDYSISCQRLQLIASYLDVSCKDLFHGDIVSAINFLEKDDRDLFCDVDTKELFKKYQNLSQKEKIFVKSLIEMLSDK